MSGLENWKITHALKIVIRIIIRVFREMGQAEVVQAGAVVAALMKEEVIQVVVGAVVVLQTEKGMLSMVIKRVIKVRAVPMGNPVMAGAVG